MAYISTWDDLGNIDSYLEVIKICKDEKLNLPLTLFINTKNLNNVNGKLNHNIINKYNQL